MKVSIEGNDLIIRIPMTKPTPSSTGKTLSVASSGGSKATEATVNGKPVVVNLNAYIAK
jgi:hypothetical protein